VSTAMTKPARPDFTALMAKISDSRATVGVRANALSQMVDSYGSDLAAILPKHVQLDRMKQLFILSVKQTPDLLDCDPASLIKAIFTASAMGLEPDPYFGQVYLVRFNKQAQVIPGYRGLLQLVRNTGEITSIACNAVCEGDEFEYDLASGERPRHKMALKGRGEAYAYYCVVNFRGEAFHFELMTRDDVEKIRKLSKTGHKGPWKDHYDEMAKKTVLRRAVKRLPISLSKELRNTLAADDAAFNGRAVECDAETGDVIDVWAETASSEAEEPSGSTPSRLDAFAGSGEPPIDVEQDKIAVSSN